jgi:hypothetical protein
MRRAIAYAGKVLFVACLSLFIFLLFVGTLFEVPLLLLFFIDSPGTYTGQDGDRAVAMRLLAALVPAWIAVASFFFLGPRIRKIRRRATVRPGRYEE